MDSAVDKTYISGRLLEQYAKERKERLDKKNQAHYLAVSKKTFAEDSLNLSAAAAASLSSNNAVEKP